MAARAQLAVCGLHRRGQPLNSQLQELGATYLKTCKSSAEYRTYVILGKDGGGGRPGMVFVTDGAGQAFELEIWNIEVAKLGELLMKVRWPLAIGTLKLEDGSSCLGFIAEGWIAKDQYSKDITHLGSWLRYLEVQQNF